MIYYSLFELLLKKHFRLENCPSNRLFFKFGSWPKITLSYYDVLFFDIQPYEAYWSKEESDSILRIYSNWGQVQEEIDKGLKPQNMYEEKGNEYNWWDS